MDQSGKGNSSNRVCNSISGDLGVLNRPNCEAPVKLNRRPRSATMLKLQWLAERVRRCERIKKAVAEGSYRVDSRDVAKAVLGIKFGSQEEN